MEYNNVRCQCTCWNASISITGNYSWLNGRVPHLDDVPSRANDTLIVSVLQQDGQGLPAVQGGKDEPQETHGRTGH